MEQIDMDRIQNNLSIHLKDYINAIIEKYGVYMSPERLYYLSQISDYRSIVRIYDYGSFNGYGSENGIDMPLCADRLLKIASKIPGFGINKKHQSYNPTSLIVNNNTFINYILHVFVSGTNTEGYYDDLLLHETMHFCGSGGSTALKEGINELLTRKLALEKGFRTNGCGYPKEVRVAYYLQQIFGEDIIDQIAFLNSEEQILGFLNNTLGTDAMYLYYNISQMMEKEFNEKYYSNMETYNGLTGIIRKTLDYRKIDYSNIYELMKSYELSKQEGNNIRK